MLLSLLRLTISRLLRGSRVEAPLETEEEVKLREEEGSERFVAMGWGQIDGDRRLRLVEIIPDLERELKKEELQLVLTPSLRSICGCPGRRIKR